MRPFLHLIAAGFADEPAKFELTVVLARLAFPYLLLICLAALLSGVLNALNRFVAAAAAPLLYNAFAIASMFALVPFVPTVGHALAIGVSLSGVAQLALLYWAVRRSGMRLHLPRPRMTPRMRLLLAPHGARPGRRRHYPAQPRRRHRDRHLPPREIRLVHVLCRPHQPASPWAY